MEQEQDRALREGFTLTGEIELVVRGKDGHIKDVRCVKNLVVDAGLAAVAGLILTDVSVNDFDYIAVGTGTVAPAAGDTALGAEIVDSGLARAAATGTRITTTKTNDTAQLQLTFSVTGTKAVTEAGMFNAASSGDMLARQTFSAVNVVNGDSLTITWKIQVS